MSCIQLWYEVLTSKVYKWGICCKKDWHAAVQYGTGSCLGIVGSLRCVGEFECQDDSGSAIKELSKEDLKSML